MRESPREEVDGRGRLRAGMCCRQPSLALSLPVWLGILYNLGFPIKAPFPPFSE